MTFLLLLPIALSAAEPQDLPPAAPPGAAAPPVASGPALTPQDPPRDTVELNDPLTDPATLTPGQIKVAANGKTPGDPLEHFNRKMFGINQAFDKAIFRPAAMGYKHVLPKQVRLGLRHFFSNLTEPVVFVNYVLQLRIGKAARTVARFAINSTVGVGGLLDVAKTKAIHLPYHPNTFGDTLAWYGVKPGPYVFLPLVGPSTLRDVLGGPFDEALVPTLVLLKVIGRQPFDSWQFVVASAVIPGLDLRAESDPELRALMDGAVDPYASLRSAWLQNRTAEVAAMHHPHSPVQPAPELGDPLRDPGDIPPAPVPPMPPAAGTGAN